MAPIDICGICGSSAVRVVPINDAYKGALCSACDTITTRTEREEGPVRHVNDSTYRLDDRVSLYSKRKREFMARYAQTVHYLARHIPPAGAPKLLEIGSNIGYFAKFAISRGFDVETVEINESLRQYQNRQLGLKPTRSIEELPQNIKYDLIVLMDVLEHMPDPVSSLTILGQLLAPTGVLFLQLPNWRSAAARLSGPHWAWWAAPDHLYHFSEQAAVAALARAGLKTIRARKVSPLLDDLASAPGLRTAAKIGRYLNRIVPINLYISNPWGSLIQIIARAN